MRGNSYDYGTFTSEFGYMIFQDFKEGKEIVIFKLRGFILNILCFNVSLGSIKDIRGTIETIKSCGQR